MDHDAPFAPPAEVSLPLLRQLNHDLRGPLNAISATNDLMLEGGYGALSATQRRAAQRVQRNAGRALIMLDHFMLYTRACAHVMETTPARFVLREVLDSAFAPIRTAAEAKGMKAILSVNAALPDAVIADEIALRRAFEALCWNTVAFCENGYMYAQVNGSASMLAIDVRDGGKGVDAEVLPRLFTPFCKGATPLTPVPTSGCGLGLAMAQALAVKAGGGVELVATGHAGSHFRLTMRTET